MLIAQHALEAGDLGGVQEDVLFAVVAASSSWDVTSGVRLRGGKPRGKRARGRIGHRHHSGAERCPVGARHGSGVS